MNVAEKKIPDHLKDVLNWAPSYHDRKMAIIFNAMKTTEHYIICGKLLFDADKKKDWKHDGSGANNFYQWAEHELGFKRTQVQRMINIYVSLEEMFKKHLELIVQVDFSKLAMIAPYLKGKTEDQKLDLLHSAKENSVRALENNLTEMKGGIATDVCDHSGPQEVFYKCSRCSKFHKGDF